MQAELVQILAACPSCRVEAAVVELVEVSAVVEVGTGDRGQVIEGRCRLCGRWERGGAVLDRGIPFRDAGQVHAALLRWARTEGEDDVHAFVASGFSGLSTDQVTAALLARRPVETSFDVIAWLFPGLAGAGGGGGKVDAGELARAAEAGPRGGGVLARSLPEARPQTQPMQPLPPQASAPEVDERRLALQALAAVMLADGVIRPGERAFLEGFAHRAGLPGLDPALVRPWRPTDLPLPQTPEPILLAMVDLSFIDHERDGSEWRVVREFARHWGYPVDKLEALGERREEQVAPAMVRLWRSLRRLLVTEG